MNRAARRRAEIREARQTAERLAQLRYSVGHYIERSAFRWFWAQVAICALLQDAWNDINADRDDCGEGKATRAEVMTVVCAGQLHDEDDA